MQENFIATELQKFNVTDAAIAEMKDSFMPLKINGIDDKEGYKKVKEARIIVKNKRIEVEKRRKELKEDSLKYGRAVDAEAKRITGLLVPIEYYLQHQEDVIEQEKDRIRMEKLNRIRERINALAEYGERVDVAILEEMPDEIYAIKLASAKAAYEKEVERKRLEDEERQRVANAQEAERKRLEQVAKEQAEKEKFLKEKEESLNKVKDTGVPDTIPEKTLEPVITDIPHFMVEVGISNAEIKEKDGISHIEKAELLEVSLSKSDEVLCRLIDSKLAQVIAKKIINSLRQRKGIFEVDIDDDVMEEIIKDLAYIILNN